MIIMLLGCLPNLFCSNIEYVALENVVISSLPLEGSAFPGLQDVLQKELMMPGDSVKRNNASGILIDDRPSCLKHLEYAQGSTVYHNGLQKPKAPQQMHNSVISGSPFLIAANMLKLSHCTQTECLAS